MKVSDAPEVAAIDLLDQKTWLHGKATNVEATPSPRQLARDGRFCPVIRRTKALEAFVARDIAKEAAQTIGRTGAHLVARAAESSMLLADSHCELRNRRRRAAAFSQPAGALGRAVLQAGKNKLTF